MREVAVQQSVVRFARSIGLTVFRNEEGDGKPDLTIFGRNITTLQPVVVHLELKSRFGKQSARQKAMQERLEKSGFKYFIGRSYKECLTILRTEYGLE